MTTTHSIGAGLQADLTPAPQHEDYFILCFHGGGGVNGTPAMLAPFCALLGQNGTVTTASASYRTLNRDKAVIGDMLADAAHALDWARATKASGARLHVLGASFGALLALDAVMNAPEGVVSLILLNPVTDTGSGGFSNRVIPVEGLPAISPISRYAGHDIMRHLRCLIGHGSADPVVPVAASERFAALWPAGRCRLVTFPNARHGFFAKPPRDQRMADHVLAFLAKTETRSG